jgi:hypothetical protein
MSTPKTCPPATSRRGSRRCPCPRGERASDVPCDGCTRVAHRRSSSTSGPTKSTRLPTSLLSCCSRRPHARGHVVMGYDERGTVRCWSTGSARSTSIARRPAGRTTVESFPPPDSSRQTTTRPASPSAHTLAVQLPDAGDRDRQAAVNAAVATSASTRTCCPAAADAETQLAVVAIQAHAVFVGRRADPPADQVRVEISRYRRPASSNPARGEMA